MYDPDTFTATMTFSDPLGWSAAGSVTGDFVQVNVKSFDGTFGVRSVDDGIPLDGFWDNPDSTTDIGQGYPSGGGSGADDFNFRMIFVPADFNSDNLVDVSDFSIWNSNKFVIPPLDEPFQLEETEYCGGVFDPTNRCGGGDATGDGLVDTSDFNAWNALKFTSRTSWPVASSPLTSGMTNFSASAALAVDTYLAVNAYSASNHSAVMGTALTSVLQAYDQLVVAFNIYDVNGDINEDLTEEEWIAFAAALDALFGTI